MNSNEIISGFILAGGKSRRMGRDKALLVFEDETLLSRSASLIRPLCGLVSVSGKNMDYISYNLPIIPDIYPDCGPIGGIHSCLAHSSTDWNLMVAVDLPFLNAELFTCLIENSADFDCVIPKSSSGIEPLVGLYNRRILPALEMQLELGDFKMMNLLQTLNVNIVDCSGLIEKFPRLFTNVNNPEDFGTI